MDAISRFPNLSPSENSSTMNDPEKQSNPPKDLTRAHNTLHEHMRDNRSRQSPYSGMKIKVSPSRTINAFGLFLGTCLLVKGIQALIKEPTVAATLNFHTPDIIPTSISRLMFFYVGRELAYGSLLLLSGCKGWRKGSGMLVLGFLIMTLTSVWTTVGCRGIPMVKPDIPYP